METVKFEELEISNKILKAVMDMGFEAASPIQAKAIPVVMSGVDMIGQAQTGTGKTAAFGIPILEKVDPKSKKLQAIVLCPTRELAIQVSEEMHKLGKYLHGIKILPVYGGQEIVKQIRSLKSGTQIIIGTPGRVMDHMRRKTIKCDAVHTIVMDEADEMLNMGFREDMETILEQIPEDRQTILFSATMSKEIQEIAKRFQKDAVTVKVVKKQLTVPSIEQYYYEVRKKNKDDILCRLLDLYAPERSLVFCNTKKKVDELVEVLKGRGYSAEGLHGDLKQIQRDRVMNAFRNGKTEILVATDVAARGIDVDDVEAVFNYDVPQDDEYYVHRIGRTGRAGRSGRAFTFVVGKEIYKLKDIQRYCKTKIYMKPVPTVDDVEQIKVEKMMERLEDIIEHVDLSKAVHVLQKQMNESNDYTSLDYAAALLHLEMGYDQEEENEDQEEYDLEGTGAEEGMVRLFINIGKKQNVRAKDILGAIAGESQIPGRVVGRIDLNDKYSFVEVPKEYAVKVLESMKSVKIKGKTIHIEPANKSGR